MASADAINQLAHETVGVTGVLVSLTMPLVLSSTGAQQRDNDGNLMRYTPHKAIIRNSGAQPVRWASGRETASPITGAYLGAGETLNFMDSGTDYFGVLNTMSFIRDVSATADSAIDITYFG